MSSEDSTSDDDSEENNDRTEQDQPDPETSSSNETSADTTSGEDDDDNSSEGSRYASFQHPMAGMYQDLYETIQATHRSLINPVDVKGVREALIESGTLSTLNTLSDPELQKQLAHPIDPESIKEIQETAATIQQLTEVPQIHPDSEIIQTLQKLNDPAILEAYETAATLEQIHQPPADQQEDRASDDQDVDAEEDASETETTSEPLEDSAQGSTFLYYTATNLLSYSDQLSEEATRYLEKIPDAEEAEQQKQYFDQAVATLGENGRERLKMIAWQWVAFIITFYYGPEAVDSSQDADTSVEAEEEADDEDQ